MKKLKKYTDQEYKELIEKVIAFGDKLWEISGYPDMEALETPPELEDEEIYLMEYSAYVYQDWIYSGYERTGGYELLPFWYVYPELSGDDVYFCVIHGMDDYEPIFWTYYDSLSEEEQKKYQEKYPVPPHFVKEDLPKFYNNPDDEEWKERELYT